MGYISGGLLRVFGGEGLDAGGSSLQCLDPGVLMDVSGLHLFLLYLEVRWVEWGVLHYRIGV